MPPDFILVGEFCEHKGPIPLLTIPKTWDRKSEVSRESSCEDRSANNSEEGLRDHQQRDGRSRVHFAEDKSSVAEDSSKDADDSGMKGLSCDPEPFFNGISLNDLILRLMSTDFQNCR